VDLGRRSFPAASVNLAASATDLLDEKRRPGLNVNPSWVHRLAAPLAECLGVSARAPDAVGAENTDTSCELQMLVYETAEAGLVAVARTAAPGGSVTCARALM
jgi:hypothetical protein